MTDNQELPSFTKTRTGNEMTLQYNREPVEKRDKIIFKEIQNTHWADHPRSMIKLYIFDVERLTELLRTGDLKADSRQGNSPPAIDLYNFMRDHHGFVAKIHVFSPYREDVDFPGDIRIVSLVWNNPDEIEREIIEKFKDKFASADEFTARSDFLKCWWD